MALLLLACIASAAILVLLCMGDPKRRRSVRRAGAAQGTMARRLLTAASLLPGMCYIVTGDPAAFLIWLGGYAVAGWLVTLFFAALSDKAARVR